MCVCENMCEWGVCALKGGGKREGGERENLLNFLLPPSKGNGKFAQESVLLPDMCHFFKGEIVHFTQKFWSCFVELDLMFFLKPVVVAQLCLPFLL